MPMTLGKMKIKNNSNKISYYCVGTQFKICLVATILISIK